MKYKVKSVKINLLKNNGEQITLSKNDTFESTEYDAGALKVREYQGMIEDESLGLPILKASDAKEAAVILEKRKKLLDEKWSKISLKTIPAIASKDLQKQENVFGAAPVAVQNNNQKQVKK